LADACAVFKETQGYRIGEKKSVAEYAQLDAEDESLARWKASLGISTDAAGISSDPTKPKVSPTNECVECHSLIRGTPMII
jgi:Rho GDP-dissociation inhibitor